MSECVFITCLTTIDEQEKIINTLTFEPLTHMDNETAHFYLDCLNLTILSTVLVIIYLEHLVEFLVVHTKKTIRFIYLSV